MRLADFLDTNAPAILATWDSFASSLTPAATGMDSTALRDHAAEILKAIVKDLRMAQSRAEQEAKSKGEAPSAPRETAAQAHAVLRAKDGFSILQLVAEYRALRASVLRLWGDATSFGPETMKDAGRFNEAIDQAIAESVDHYSSEVERFRALFLGILGHDLRGPLNAVLLTAHTILAMDAGKPVRPQTERLIRSGERMRQLLDDLLDYNRTSLQVGLRVSIEATDLSIVCREELELLRAALPSSSIEFTGPASLEGRWDPSRIRQVVSNLVTNAAKYGDPDGTIRVKLERKAGAVALSVENSGASIPNDLLRSLFEPLRRHAAADDDGPRESLGLGLYIAREVALAHGGEIEATSAEGLTCFTMTLPAGGP